MSADQQASQQTLDAAVLAAKQSGVPQPVRGAGGQTLYYVDWDGAVVPAAIAEDRIQHAAAAKGGRDNSAGMLTSTGGLTTAAERAQNSAAAQQATSDAAAALARYNASHPPVWVNGQRAEATSLNPDGTAKTFSFIGSKTPGMPDQVVDPQTGLAMDPKKTAFAALDVGASYGMLAGISGDDRFTMSQGPVDVNTGMAPRAGAYGPPGSGDHSESANTVSDGTSQMTIADGLQWMVNLSTQNPTAYDLLVKQLKHAGYFGTNPGDMIGGGYSEQAGLGFVKAMKDLSVVQSATGVNTSMDDFLAGKNKAVEAAAGATYQPVNRDYTDPGTLMATAKTAAEDAIGRNLTPAELAAFEAHFRSQQSSYYDSVDASGKAQVEAKAIGESAPGSQAVAPSADGSANALLQGGQFDQQRANYGVEQYTQALQSLFNVQ